MVPLFLSHDGPTGHHERRKLQLGNDRIAESRPSPWTLKFLWSPFVDRHCITVGDYKRTIIATELSMPLHYWLQDYSIYTLRWCLSSSLSLSPCFASATQDIATDALAILSFKKTDRSMLNSMQSMGAFGGAVIGSGILLIALKSYGWSTVVTCLAAFVLDDDCTLSTEQTYHDWDWKAYQSCHMDGHLQVLQPERKYFHNSAS